MPNRYATTIFLGEHSFYSPKFVFIELFKHKEKITKCSKLTEDEILELLHRLLKRIRISEEKQISKDSLYQAYELCKNIDLKDMLFVALTIELDGYLWTSDDKLKKGLIKEGFTSFYEGESTL